MVVDDGPERSISEGYSFIRVVLAYEGMSMPRDMGMRIWDSTGVRAPVQTADVMMPKVEIMRRGRRYARGMVSLKLGVLRAVHADRVASLTKGWAARRNRAALLTSRQRMVVKMSPRREATNWAPSWKVARF